MAPKLLTLVVDPNVESRLDVVRALDAVGLDICGEATYGTEAIYMASIHHPDVIILALEDPPVRGLATLEALRQQQPDTPVLVYSTSEDPQLMRLAMRAGARDFVEKPLRESELRDAIGIVLSQDEQRKAAHASVSGPSAARGTVLTVAGAKGGIGKTTLATNLAVAIRQATGQDVALVDADAQFGDVAVMLDIEPDRSVADLARDEEEIDRHVAQGYLKRHGSGIDVLLAASEPDDWRAVHPEHISALARALSETHEYVIIDTPGVMNETVAASLNEAAIVFLVTSLDVSSVKDTRTALRILQSWAMPQHRIRLIINDNTRAPVVSPADIERTCEVSAAHVIPHDERVGISVQTGMPIVRGEPRSAYARAVKEIAEQVTGVSSREPSFMRSPLRRLALFGRRA